MKLNPRPLTVFLLTLALVLPDPDGTLAEIKYQPPFTKENISPVRVALDDNAENGCWTNLNEAKDYAEGQLNLAEIETTKDNAARTYLAVRVSSTKASNGLCYGSVRLSLQGYTDWDDGRAYVTLLQASHVFANAKNANAVILDLIKDASMEIFQPLPRDILDRNFD